MRRNGISCQALNTFAIVNEILSNNHTVQHNMMTDMVNQMEIGALTRASAYTAGMCYAQFSSNQAFPPHILDTDALDNSQEEIKSYLLCMATPQEYEESNETPAGETEQSNGNRRRRRSRCEDGAPKANEVFQSS